MYSRPCLKQDTVVWKLKEEQPMKNIASILLCNAFLVSASANAQTAAEVTGTIIDSQNRPIEFANVALLSVSDSSFIAGAMTDANGRFAIPCKAEKAMVKVSCVGYEVSSGTFTIGDIGTITLRETVNTLEGVVVKGHRKMFEMKDGGLVAQVKGTALSDAGTANDVIAKVPSVYSENGKYSVYGKGEAMIYINGRKLVDYDELERLSSKDIASIVLDNNPGAKYDATVKAVIHVKTVKKQGEGLSGSVSAMYRQSHYSSTEDGIQMNWRKGGLDIFGSVFYALKQIRQEQSDNVETWKDNDVWRLHNETTMHGKKPVTVNPRLGFNYSFNDRHSLGMTYSMTHAPNMSYDIAITQNVVKNGTPLESIRYNTDMKNKARPTHLANAYYRGKIGTLEIAFDNDIMASHTKNMQHVDQESSESGKRQVHSTNVEDNLMVASKIVVSHPVGAGHLDVGGEIIYTDRKQSYNNEENIIASTDDHIKETKYAGFMSYSVPFGKSSVKAGLRYEHTVSDYYEKGVWVAGQSRRYNKLFPTLAFSSPIGKTMFNISYTMKTRRPSYRELSSNMQYDDAFTYESGNPLLRPELIHDITLSASYRWLYMNISYQHVKDAITSSTELLDGSETPINVMSNTNRPSLNKYSATISLTPRFGIWSPRLSVSLTGQDLKIVSRGATMRLNNPMLSAGMYNSVTIPGNFILSADITARTYGNTGVVTVYPSWQVNAGIVKKLGLWTLQLQGTDMFRTARNSFMLYGTSMRHKKWNYSDTQSVKLTISYRFNQTGSKYKGTGAGNDEKYRLQ